MSFIKLNFIFALICLSGISAASTLSAIAQTSVSTDDESQIRMQAFEKVWNTVNEKHYDPKFGGVDWKNIRETYLPKVSAVKSNDELHKLLMQMLGELGLSHFAIHQQSLPEMEETSGNGTAGIEVIMLDGSAVIERVSPGLGAYEAGIKPGFIIRAINEKSVADILKPLEESFTDRELSETVKNIYRSRLIAAAISGKPGDTVELRVIDETDKEVALKANLEKTVVEMSPAVGNFPPQPLLFESKKLDKNIGYIRFNIWVVPQMMKIRQAMTELKDTDGLIIDVRGNPGGLGAIATGFAGLLSDKQLSLGSMRSRDNVMQFIAYPQREAYLKPVVILQDGGSGSTSEVFAAGLQEQKRATIVGTTSAGAVLPSIFDTLPTGAIFQYAISDYRSPNDILIEGRGVIPDIEAEQTREALLNGRDAQLDSALAHIKNLLSSK